ncbi:hypothetical protein PybrP1_010130 [[Pythium] brassicae (nom. inval.)]|nr:hypothetical protein PybrP1_010130 [[Pythium] brassicae (nom. inval.)]
MLHVVVTPGSPASKHANDALLLARRPRFIFQGHRAAGSSASPPLLLYVTDAAASDKWVLAKSAADYQELRKQCQQVLGVCRKFACCGPLRRIAKSPLYKAPRRKRSDSAVVSHFELAQTVQEFVNDLLLAVFAREHQCESTAAARLVLDRFLDLAAHRASGADRTLRRSSLLGGAPEVEGRQSASCSSNSTGAAAACSHSECECPICCAELRSEQTLQLPCSHVFHSACVHVWLNVQHTCPVCRVALDASSASP